MFSLTEQGEETQSKNITLTTKPPSTRAGKAEAITQRVLNEAILPMRRKRSITISHTQQRTTPISTPISTKEKELGHEKKRRPTQGARKNKKKNVDIF